MLVLYTIVIAQVINIPGYIHSRQFIPKALNSATKNSINTVIPILYSFLEEITHCNDKSIEIPIHSQYNPPETISSSMLKSRVIYKEHPMIPIIIELTIN